MNEILRRSGKGHAVACPKCGHEIMSAEATSVELEVVYRSVRDIKVKIPCGCVVWAEDIDRFNRDSGYRSLRYGCFTENLIPQGERIRVFCYVDAEIEGMLSHLGYEMVFEEVPSSEEMDDEGGSYPICSGEQIWVRGMSIVYVNRQYCGCSGFSGNTHVAVVGTIRDWRQVANLIDLHYERTEGHGRGGPSEWFRSATNENIAHPNRVLFEKIFEATEGFRMIFGGPK